MDGNLSMQNSLELWEHFDPYSDEIWKDIKGYEGLYQISSMGNIRSLDRVVTCINGREANYKGKSRKPSILEYRIISLSKGNKVAMKKISRLVALHFLSNPDNKKLVNHKDGNKHNDNFMNLEWCSYSENSIHSFEKGLSLKKNKVSGVFYEKRRNKWAAYLYRNSKNIFIGRFKTEEEAVKARQKYINDNN
jgi:hypothetical protein